MIKENVLKLEYNSFIYSNKCNQLCRVVTPPNVSTIAPLIEAEVVAGTLFTHTGNPEKKSKLTLDEVEADYEIADLVTSRKELDPHTFAALNLIMINLNHIGVSVAQMTNYFNSIGRRP
jgi:hypothetical protein